MRLIFWNGGKKFKMDAIRLKTKMIEENMNVECLADAIGCNKSTLYRAIKNPEKITIGMALKIKLALNMTHQEAREIFLD